MGPARRICIAALGLALATSGAARGSEPAAAAAAPVVAPVAGKEAAAVAPDALRRRELVRRYFAAIGLSATMDAMLAGLVPTLVEQRARELPATTPEIHAAVTAAARETLAEVSPRMIEMTVETYADAFSEGELGEMVRFYEGPTGRAIVAKSQALVPLSAEIFKKMTPQIENGMFVRLCEKIDCLGQTPRPARPAAKTLS